MAISFVNVGAWAVNASTSTYSLTPALPTSWAAGDMLLLFVHHKTSAATVATPSGWTALVNGVSANGAGYAADAGDTRTYIFYKVATAGMTAPTVTLSGGTTGNTGNNMLAQIGAYRAGGGVFFTPVGVVLAQSASTTSWSQTTTSFGNLVTGEWLVGSSGWMSDSPAMNSATPTQTGLTFAAATLQTGGSGTSGSDMAARSWYSSVSSGTSSSTTTTLAHGMSATAYGTIGAVELQEDTSPTITSLSPTYGVTAGGASVVITGTNFTGTTGAASVKFGGTNAASYTVNSNTQITAVAPAGSRGSVDVSVTNSGTSANTAADDFTYMNAYEAVPAGGTWSTAATWAGGAAPTSTSDVYLGASSGSVTMTSTSVIRSVDCTGYAATLTQNTTVKLVIGDASPGASNIALKFAAGMTYTTADSSCQIYFASTSATQQSVDFAGKTVRAMLFGLDSSGSGVAGGSWNIATHPTAGSTLYFYGGTLSMATGGGYASFASLSSLTRVLTLGSTSQTFTAGGTAWTMVHTGLTVTANTATVTLTGADAVFDTTGVDFNGMTLSMTGSGTASITGANTFGALSRIGTAVKTDGLTLGADQTLTGSGTSLTLKGNAGSGTFNQAAMTNRMLVASDVLGAQRTFNLSSTGSYGLNSVDLSDMGVTNAVGGSSGTDTVGDAGGNSGFTLSSGTIAYAKLTGNSNWSSAVWYTTSGGSTAERVPLPQDSAVIDGSSGAFTLTADMPRLCGYLGFSFAGSSPTALAFDSIATTVYGYADLNGTVTGTFPFTIRNRQLTGSGNAFIKLTSFSMPVTLESWGGATTVFSLNGPVTSTSSLNLSRGTLDDNGQAVSVASFSSTGTATRSLTATGAWTLTGTSGTVFDVSGSGLTMTTSTASFAFAASSSTRTFSGGGFTYGTLTYTAAGSTGSLTLDGSNTFTTLNFSDVTNARTLTCTAGTTQTVTNFNVNGTLGKLMSVISSNSGFAANLVKAGGGVVSSDYLSLKDSHATPSGDWFAGTHSTDVSGNTGWTFTAPVLRRTFDDSAGLVDNVTFDHARLAPDAILASSGTTGVVASVQDDPDSSDANKITTSGAWSLRLSFPTPPATLLTGADLQRFRVKLS